MHNRKKGMVIKMKKLSVLFWVLAVLLSDAMCAVVGYMYCDIKWGIRYAGYSAPLDTAFAYAVPFIIGIVVCVILAAVLEKKSRT